MLEAAAFSDYRLSEVFAGYDRAETGFPVRYPTARAPQAWAAAAPFLWLRVMLGLERTGNAATLISRRNACCRHGSREHAASLPAFGTTGMLLLPMER